MGVVGMCDGVGVGFGNFVDDGIVGCGFFLWWCYLGWLNVVYLVVVLMGGIGKDYCC